jgi:hypothetical protein
VAASRDPVSLAVLLLVAVAVEEPVPVGELLAPVLPEVLLVVDPLAEPQSTRHELPLLLQPFATLTPAISASDAHATHFEPPGAAMSTSRRTKT